VGKDNWGVQVTRLLAPPPATPSSASPASGPQGASNLSVVVTGTSATGSGFYDPGTGFPNHLSATVSGTGVTVASATYTDATHVTLVLNIAPSATLAARTRRAT
jgi:hypothetical protein